MEINDYTVYQYGRGFNITFDKPEGYETFRSLVDYSFIFDGYPKGVICIGILSDKRYFIEDVCTVEPLSDGSGNKQRAITYVSEFIDDLTNVLLNDYNYEIDFINSKLEELW